MSNLPTIYPNETIYSWLARAFILSGYVNEQEFYKSIFDVAKVRLHPYLNNRISQLAVRSNLSEEQLINEHTLYPLFNAFVLKENQKNLKSRLLSNEVLAVSTAGITQFNYSIFHGHKYCPICITEDVKKCGVGYWHLEHQIPAVCACYKHNALLYGIQSGETKLDRDLTLPAKASTVIMAHKGDIKLAKFSASLLSILQGDYSEINYQKKYYHQLSNKNLLTSKGQLRSKKIIINLQNFWGDSTPYSKNELSIPDELFTFDFIGRLYRTKDHHASHPLKHLLFMCWLLDNDTNLLFKNPKHKIIPSNSLHPQVGSDEMIIERLRNGDSYNNIYRQTGRSRCYIKRLACMNSITCISTGKKIDKVMVRRILIKALLGQHRKLIAAEFNISVGSVEQFISSEPTLVAWRKELRYQNKKAPYFEEITSFIKNNPDCYRKDVKAECNAAFFWCFLNEKKWLNRELPLAIKPIRQQCDWAARDNEAVIKINEVLIESIRAISITRLDNLIGGKRWLTRFIHKLPKSKQVIAKSIKNNKLWSQTPEKYFL
jgi:hypothetical protein